MGKITGDDAIEWIQEYCRIPEGQLVGQPVRLTDEQKDWLRLLYDSPTRMFLLSMARKNAKTALSAFLLLFHLCGYAAKPNSQLYSAAQSRDQAAILFALAAKVVRMSPDLNSTVVVRDTAKQLFHPELGTLYRALSAEASTAYGLSPVFVVHDELGQVRGPRSELFEALETASAAQESPLSIVISTQAPNAGDLLSILIDDALTGEDPTVKCVMYSAPEDLDPFSEEAIRAANPHFDDFMNKDEVFKQAASAKRMPSREASYRNLILNQRVDLNSPLIPRSIWEASAGADLSAFEDGEVFLALDLSARNDLTAAVGLTKSDKWHAEAHFWVPETGLYDRSKRDRVPYDLWVKQGHVTATPGSSVDYAFIAKWLVDYCGSRTVRKIAFDRWRIDVLIAELQRLGAEDVIELMEPFGQGYKDMAPAVDTFEADLLNDEFRHPENPALTWCASNAIAVSDPAGNRKLDKAKSSGRIDGAVAMVMARGVAAKYMNEEEDIDDFLAAPVRY